MNRYKFPRTYHLPFSLGLQSDDKQIGTLDQFEGKEIVVLEKMDGENTTLYQDGFSHARSIDSKSNWTRNFAKKKHAEIIAEIPSNHRLCCENVYATHSIDYPDGHLDSYLYLLSVWNNDICLSWDETLYFSQCLSIPTPKQLYRGIFDYKKLVEISKQLNSSIEEGFVIRITNQFEYDDYSRYVAKYVRENHVQTDVHWLKTAKPNGKPKDLIS